MSIASKFTWNALVALLVFGTLGVIVLLVFKAKPAAAQAKPIYASPPACECITKPLNGSYSVANCQCGQLQCVVALALGDGPKTPLSSPNVACSK